MTSSGTFPPPLSGAPQIEALPLRVAAKIVVDQPGGCWRWTASTNKCGYGLVGWRRGSWLAHRLVYTLLVGPIEADTLDHTCHSLDPSCTAGDSCAHRRCVNPMHLEPASRRVNTLRGRGFATENAMKTHCPQGHPYDGDNLVLELAGRARRCLECRRERGRRARATPEHLERQRAYYRAHKDEIQAQRKARRAAEKKEAVA